MARSQCMVGSVPQITDKAHLKQERGFVSNLGLLKTHFEFLTPTFYSESFSISSMAIRAFFSA